MRSQALDSTYPWQQPKDLYELLELKAQYKFRVIDKAVKYDQQESDLKNEIELLNQSLGRSENVEHYRFKMAALDKELETLGLNKLRLKRDKADLVNDIENMARTLFAHYENMLYDHLDGTLPVQRFIGYLNDYRSIMIDNYGLKAFQIDPAEKIWVKIRELCPNNDTNN